MYSWTKCNRHYFSSFLRESRVVLCNPPFAKFTKSERAYYTTISSPLKPASYFQGFWKIFAQTEFRFYSSGFCSHGQSYIDIREKLAARFSEIEVVLLPERVFAKANFPLSF